MYEEIIPKKPAAKLTMFIKKKIPNILRMILKRLFGDISYNYFISQYYWSVIIWLEK